MRVIIDPADLEASAGGVFVPTMGALHEGHLSLVRRARELGGPVVVSIFVNPTQFGPAEDWSRYPRTPDADLEGARSAGADVVFAPDVETMYPPGRDVPVPELPAVATRPRLEDVARPGHFAGVCQVVARLFDLVRPSAAVFGEKDYQQLLVVSAVAAGEAARWPGLRIVAHPTVRDPGGLALSSRNAYLRPQQRESALCLIRALREGQAAADGGASPAAAEHAMRRVLEAGGLSIDYAAVRDAATLMPIESWTRPARALVAARVGEIRLIDNVEVSPRS